MSPSHGQPDDAPTTGAGMGYMIQAAFWFAVMALLVKLAGKTGLPTMQIVLVRACVTLTLSSFTLWHARIPPFGNNTRLLLLRGLFGSGGLMCFYAAINHLPLAEATVIHQISPVLTAVVAAIWAMAVGLLICLLLAIVAQVEQPATVAPWLWLVGHHIGFSTSTGVVTLLPVGLILVCLLPLRRAGRFLKRQSGSST
ncbi:MAG TPA: hypothetical protein EYP98_07630, partial [Planctomycetes bacterium]|nr:hypothetical protein [Planctomycetota bacterium]